VAAGSSPVGRAEGPWTHYVVVRDDLPLGVLAAQIVHAAAESWPGGLPPGTRAVVLAARDEEHLLALERQLVRDGIGHVAIHEPDPPWHGQLMAIGMVPVVDRQPTKHVTGRLRLLA
jgi:peptidyl-tRNA hydrolase